MKALLVLVAMHVLNVFIVTLHTSERNTSNCSWTNTQKHFNQYNNMNILAMPCDMLLNHLWKLEKWEFEQSLPLSNNITSTSSLQISNNELIQSTNIIRIFQSTLFADSNQFKKNWHSKTLIIKRAADRSEYRLWTLAVINCFWCSAATSTNPTTSISAAAADFFTNPAISKHKFSQRQTRPSISLKVSPQFGKHCPMLQCLDNVYLEQLSNQLQLLAQTVTTKKDEKAEEDQINDDTWRRSQDTIDTDGMPSKELKLKTLITLSFFLDNLH
ncbi:hypothetical protein RFI_06081 [Reticulomyxa filosa]|uniref:Uncharacterized protein n=1 Tax=Reticulomyxa filosa TaxID=46433 RepID=X6NYX4_RETFI|nr:hypothetical protein RFI_06081 [Reticulomyxa filosa]|eukprot:ETO31039.1 hypothetical protein RFI_06081 [Reticulomyxa filosa]